jgi:hypothetical protein
MTGTPATAAEVRDSYKADGYEVRIGRDGHVTYRPNRDYHPGAPTNWLEGGWVHDYRLRDYRPTNPGITLTRR